MKPSECKMCGLCKSRSHISFNKGRKPANVLIIFGAEPRKAHTKTKMDVFVKKLNELLEWDWHYTFAIRCCAKKSIKLKYIQKCRYWLSATIKRVDPYLIILMGSIALKSIFGERYVNLPQNVFYMKKNKNGKKRLYFVGPKITAQPAEIEESLNKLLLYIEEHYG
jgi:uracil-DNA glycosylase